MTLALPDSPSAFTDARLEDVEPYFRELAERPLDDIPAWLEDWSRLEALFTDADYEAEIAYDRDTTDAVKEQAALRFASEISPQLEPWRVRLAERLVASGYARPDLETTIRRWRNRIELFRAENVPLYAELEKLGSRYSKVTGGMTVDWEGERLTPSQVRPFAASGDRAVRERAWRAFFRPYVEARDELAAIFDSMYELRQRIAVNAGFANYRDFGHRQKDRFDYSPEDCERFHDGVEATVVPAVERIYARRARLMGLDGAIRPWDAIDGHVAAPDPLGRPPLRPFSTQQELVEGCRRVYGAVDSELAAYFERLVEGDMLDLMARPGKAPGGYCATFPHRGLPFIFMNSSGIANDVDTLLHESGHAFHALEAMSALPLVFQRFAGSEMAEVASMSMELLGSPHLVPAVYADQKEARRAREAHLEELLVGLAHIASVDAFQHWIYTSGEGGDAGARDRKWLELRRRFGRGVDWSGCEAEQIARWYEQIHFFNYPLYYIEYGIAQFGALQVWRNSLSDAPGAVADYRRALALGGSRPLPELFAAAGAELVFDGAKMLPLVELVEEELDQLARG